jgi:hypothetical protein
MAQSVLLPAAFTVLGLAIAFFFVKVPADMPREAAPAPGKVPESQR